MTSDFDSLVASRLGAKCQSAQDAPLAIAPVVSAADSPVIDGDTGKTISGAGFGGSQGDGKLELTDADTYSGSSTFEEQTITSWAGDEIEYTVSQGSLSEGTVYGYVESDTGHRSAAQEITLDAAAGTYYACGGGGVKVYDPDADEWVALGSAGNTPQCLAILNNKLYAGFGGTGSGVKVYDPSGGSWTAVGSTSQKFLSIAAFNNTLYGVNTTGTLYEIDVDTGTYTSRGSPNSSQSIRYLEALGSYLYLSGGFTSFGGVSASNIVAYNGTTFSDLNDGDKAPNSIGIAPSAGALVCVSVEKTTGFPVQRAPGSWNGSSWTWLGSTNGNDGTISDHLGIYGGFYNTMGGSGLRSDGSAPWTAEGFFTGGANTNRVRSDSNGVYSAMASNDSTHSTTIIKFNDYGDRNGFKFGDSPPNPAWDILIGISTDDLE